MVRLRLSVKVFPREQVQPPSSSLSFRSLFGEPKEDASGNGGKSSGSTARTAKPVSFLLVLDEPEKITMGGLAWEIQEKWKKLRPDAGPLDIKKLLDDDHDSDDIDVEMTVADAFVDRGKGRKDGFDQRATVRVIQKPSSYAPTRFPSVAQDWDAAAQDFQREEAARKSKNANSTEHNFPTIVEEPSSDSSPSVGLLRWSPSPSHNDNDGRDHIQENLPVSSVEDQVPEVHSQGRQRATPTGSRAGTPPRMGSIELGSFTPSTVREQDRSFPSGFAHKPAPDFKTKLGSDKHHPPNLAVSGNLASEVDGAKERDTNVQSRKRKPKPGSSQKARKEPRLEKANSRPSNGESPARKRLPSFVDSDLRCNLTDTAPQPPGSIGLGITASPSKRRSTQDMNSAAQHSSLYKEPAFSSSAPAAHNSTPEKGKILHSVLRKDDPPSSKGQRSVSFTRPRDDAADATDSADVTMSLSQGRSSDKRPTVKERSKKERLECEQLGNRIVDLEKQKNGDTEYVSRLREVYELWSRAIKFQLSKKGGSSKIAYELRLQLDSRWKELEHYQDTMTDGKLLRNRDNDTAAADNKEIGDETSSSKKNTFAQDKSTSARKKTLPVNGRSSPAEQNQSQKQSGKIRSPTPAPVLSQVDHGFTDDVPAASPSISSHGDFFDANPVLRPEKTAESTNRNIADGEQGDDPANQPFVKLTSSYEDGPAGEGKIAAGGEDEPSDDESSDDGGDKDSVPEDYVPETSKADLLKRVNIPTSSPATKSPFQPSPQWQAVNNRPTLKSLRISQNAEQAERAATAPKPDSHQKTADFSSFGLESDDEDNSSDSSNHDDGDIMFSGTSSKLRTATRRR